MSPRVVLVGPMGAGKTTVGKRLAAHFALPFVDLDAEIETHTGAGVALIFDIEGEPGFRRRESALLEECSARAGVVLATGGGAVLDAHNRELLKSRGFEHPLGEHWRGYQDIDPGVLTRERILDMLSRFRPEMLLAVTPHGTPKQIAQIVKGFVDAGLRVPKILDYGGMAGLKFAASSAQKVREAEDELMKLCGDIA